MAMYMEPTKQRRTVAVAAVVALVVGVLVGYLVGHGAAATAADVAASARSKGGDAASAFSRLPIEYDQAVSAASGESSATVLEAVDAASALLDDANRAAPWLGPALRKPPADAVDALRSDVRSGASSAQFQQDVDATTAAIGTAFNLQTTS